MIYVKINATFSGNNIAQYNPLCIIFTRRLKWNHETIYSYKKELGLEKEENYQESDENVKESKVPTTGNGPHQNNYESHNKNKTINYNIMKYVVLSKQMSLACGFPGNSLHDHMWEYLSLRALNHRYAEIMPTLSVKTSNSLKRLLQPINMPVINEIRESDYDLAYARIIGHTTPILPIETFENKRAPLILERFAKRHAEIVNANLIYLRQFVKFNKWIEAKAHTELNKIKVRHGFNTIDSNVHWVGLYTDNSTVS